MISDLDLIERMSPHVGHAQPEFFSRADINRFASGNGPSGYVERVMLMKHLLTVWDSEPISLRSIARHLDDDFVGTVAGSWCPVGEERVGGFQRRMSMAPSSEDRRWLRMWMINEWCFAEMAVPCPEFDDPALTRQFVPVLWCADEGDLVLAKLKGIGDD